MALQNLGGAPNFFSIVRMRSWLDVSKAFTRSGKITYVSRSCCLRRLTRVFRVKFPS